MEVDIGKTTRIDLAIPCDLLREPRRIFYFAERDREVLKKLRSQLRKVKNVAAPRSCPKCPGRLEGYTFEGFALDRRHECGGVWLDRGELEAIVRKIRRGPLGAWLDTLAAKT